MVKPKDHLDLADKILELKNNQQLREKIAKGGYKLYQEKLRPVILVNKLIEKFGEIRNKD